MDETFAIKRMKKIISVIGYRDEPDLVYGRSREEKFWTRFLLSSDTEVRFAVQELARMRHSVDQMVTALEGSFNERTFLTIRHGLVVLSLELEIGSSEWKSPEIKTAMELRSHDDLLRFGGPTPRRKIDIFRSANLISTRSMEEWALTLDLKNRSGYRRT